jgi:hypothetical protein
MDLTSWEEYHPWLACEIFKDTRNSDDVWRALGQLVPTLWEAPAYTSLWRGRYPKGAVTEAIAALEASRVDTKEGGAVRGLVEDALELLYRARALNEPKTQATAPQSSPTVPGSALQEKGTDG